MSYVCALIFNYYSAPVLVLAQSFEEKEQRKQTEKSRLVGNIEVDVNLALPMKNVVDPNLNLKLKEKEGHLLGGSLKDIPDNGLSKALTLGDQNISMSIRKLGHTGMDLGNTFDKEFINYYSVTFYGLQVGTYQIETSGNGYQTLEVKVKGYMKKSVYNKDNNTITFYLASNNRQNLVNNKQQISFGQIQVKLKESSGEKDFQFKTKEGSKTIMINYTYKVTNLEKPGVTPKPSPSLMDQRKN